MKDQVIWLRLSCWTGAVIDALAALLLTIPGFAVWFSGVDLPLAWPAFRTSNAQAAALMWGWTLLLVWADRRPVERRGVVALTIFPVLAWLITSRLQEMWIYQAPLERCLPLLFLQLGLVTLFGYSLWVNRKAPSPLW